MADHQIGADSLVEKARRARQHAYCPYSGFAVGAALLASSGQIYTGANCESASYGATLCAERAALAAAISAGERTFLALAVAAGERPVTPCGICRQLLAEFGDFPVYCAAGTEAVYAGYVTHMVSSLLPAAFDREHL